MKPRSLRSIPPRSPSPHPTFPSAYDEGMAGVPVAHPLALPPTWDVYPPPLVASRVVVPRVGRSGARSADVGGAAAWNGAPVRQVAWSWADPPALGGRSALWIGDRHADADGLTWTRLTDIADRGAVLISLGALAAVVNRVSPRSALLRLRRQRELPTCARVEYANWVTRGFALQDVFAYGWREPSGGACVQRQLVDSTRLRGFCRRHALTVLLESVARSDYGSNHPLALSWQGRRGFLLAIDVEPPATSGPAEPISPYPERLVRQALGLADPGRGQYAVSPSCVPDFEQAAIALCDRFPPMRWVPTNDEPGAPPLGWIDVRARAGAGATLGPPPPAVSNAGPRVLCIRSGFSPGEWDVVYGVFTWLKQLCRPPLAERRELAAMLSRWAIQWIPLADASAVPPPPGPKAYAYLVRVPPQMRRCRVVERPAAPDVWIDVRRGPGETIVVRVTGRRATGSSWRGESSRLSARLGIPVSTRSETARVGDAGRCWDISFPVESAPSRYDAITSSDRVVQSLDAVVHRVTP